MSAQTSGGISPACLLIRIPRAAARGRNRSFARRDRDRIGLFYFAVAPHQAARSMKWLVFCCVLYPIFACTTSSAPEHSATADQSGRPMKVLRAPHAPCPSRQSRPSDASRPASRRRARRPSGSALDRRPDPPGVTARAARPSAGSLAAWAPWPISPGGFADNSAICFIAASYSAVSLPDPLPPSSCFAPLCTSYQSRVSWQKM